jgi:hypothetical protein
MLLFLLPILSVLFAVLLNKAYKSVDRWRVLLISDWVYPEIMTEDAAIAVSGMANSVYVK